MKAHKVILQSFIQISQSNQYTISTAKCCLKLLLKTEYLGITYQVYKKASSLLSVKSSPTRQTTSLHFFLSAVLFFRSSFVSSVLFLMSSSQPNLSFSPFSVCPSQHYLILQRILCSQNISKIYRFNFQNDSRGLILLSISLFTTLSVQELRRILLYTHISDVSIFLRSDFSLFIIQSYGVQCYW